MKFSAKQYAQALLEGIESTDPMDQEKVLDNFVALLSQNNDVKLLDQIIEEFEKLRKEQEGVKIAETFSKHELGRTESHLIVEHLNTVVKSDVELKKRIDESLIGGVVVRVDDQILDASINNSLKQLKDELTS